MWPRCTKAQVIWMWQQQLEANHHCSSASLGLLRSLSTEKNWTKKSWSEQQKVPQLQPCTDSAVSLKLSTGDNLQELFFKTLCFCSSEENKPVPFIFWINHLSQRVKDASVPRRTWLPAVLLRTWDKRANSEPLGQNKTTIKDIRGECLSLKRSGGRTYQGDSQEDGLRSPGLGPN